MRPTPIQQELKRQRQVAAERQEHLKFVQRWLQPKLKLGEVNKRLAEFYKGDSHIPQVALTVLNAYYDDGSDLGSEPEDVGFHVEVILDHWNGPLNLEGIDDSRRRIQNDIYGRPVYTKFELVVKDPRMVAELQTIYLAKSWQESVDTHGL